MRPTAEPLSKALARLSATLKKSTPVMSNIALGLRGADDTTIDPHTCNVEAWSQAACLSLGESGGVPIIFEPPEVTYVHLPVMPIVGIPMRPAVALRNCEVEQCCWLWEVLRSKSHSCASPSVKERPSGADAEESHTRWSVVCRESEYVPTAADVGRRLRVRVSPPPLVSPEASTLGTQTAVGSNAREVERALLSATLSFDGLAEAVGAVVEHPPRQTVARRVHALSAHRHGAKETFRVLSYNLLAEAYSRHWDESSSVHSYCEARLTRAAHRMPRLLAEVLDFDADLICLQEVDRAWYDSLWLPSLEARGFVGAFALKRGAGSSEGCATFVRATAFEVLEVHSAPLDVATPPPQLRDLLEAQSATREGMRALPTVAQLLVLRPTADASTADASTADASTASRRRIVLANTHLYFANPAVHVRLMQTAALLHYAHECIYRVRAPTHTAEPSDTAAPKLAAAASKPAEPPQVALIVAGDLNSDATDAVLRLLTTGAVAADDPDWLHGALMWRHSLPDALTLARSNGSLCADSANEAHADAQNGDADGENGEEVDVSLARAQSIASSFHQLRRALIVLDRVYGPITTTQSKGEDDGAGAESRTTTTTTTTAKETTIGTMDEKETAAAVHDFEPTDSSEQAGRNSLASVDEADSEVVSAILVVAEALGLLKEKGGTQEARRMARAHLAQLASELQTAARVLRERVGAGCDGGGTSEVSAAGTNLHNPKPLDSAYGLHNHPTHVLPSYQNALDWICVDKALLEVLAVAPLPTIEELTKDVAMPSAEFPSDHVSLVADIAWRSGPLTRVTRPISGGHHAPSK